MKKIVNLQATLPDEIDCLLITSEIHQRYISGFPFTDGYVVVSRDKAWLLTDFRYIEAAKKHEDDSLSVEMFDNRRVYFGNLLADNGFTRVGFEDDMLTCAELRALQESHPSVTFVPAGGLIEKLRRTKSQDEVDCMIKAQRIAEKSLERLFSLMTPDMTEKDVALELDFGIRKFGGDGNSFDTIAVSGTASSMPHGVPRDVKLEKGFLTMDFGAVYNGYMSDMTRTIVIGKADAEIKKVYNTVLKAQLAGISSIAAGKTGFECDKAARDIINEAGYEGCFGHSLGHGVGMFIHEGPSLSTRFNKPLCVGDVVTIEPGIYIPGKYGCRIEDMAYITENGIINLTKAPKELIEMF